MRVWSQKGSARLCWTINFLKVKKGKKNQLEVTLLYYRDLCLIHVSLRLLEHILEAFWNHWTLSLDFGPGNAGLWTKFSGNLGPKTHKIAADFLCFGAESSVHSPAFPGPKSRPRVQRFKNAYFGVCMGSCRAMLGVSPFFKCHMYCRGFTI